MRTREQKQQMLETALDLKADLSALKRYKNCNDLVKIEQPYSIERIRRGFSLYRNKEIDKEYFFLWCRLCARVIETQCTEYCHIDAAKQEISWRLNAVASGSAYEEMLEDIENLHLIISGERESDLWLAKDIEYVCLQVGEDDYVGFIYDLIVLNHRRKTYDIRRGVDDFELDSVDAFDNVPNCIYASTEIFDLLYQNLSVIGYEKVENSEG